MLTYCGTTTTTTTTTTTICTAFIKHLIYIRYHIQRIKEFHFNYIKPSLTMGIIYIPNKKRYLSTMNTIRLKA